MLSPEIIADLRRKVANGTITDDELQSFVRDLRADRVGGALASAQSKRAKAAPSLAKQEAAASAQSKLDAFLKTKGVVP